MCARACTPVCHCVRERLYPASVNRCEVISHWQPVRHVCACVCASHARLVATSCLLILGKADRCLTPESSRVQPYLNRVGHNYIIIRCTYIRYFWQGNHQIYGHARCITTVLANPTLYPLSICTFTSELISTHPKPIPSQSINRAQTLAPHLSIHLHTHVPKPRGQHVRALHGTGSGCMQTTVVASCSLLM